jgi:nicotinate-nucleotide adenylyltransferase
LRIGVFGGTFNPLHYGHLRAAEEVREMLSLERVLFIPSGNPPLKTEDIAEAAQRFGMVSLAVKDNPLFDALDIECASPGKSYTVNTVEALRERYPDASLFFILGIDAFLDIVNWWQPERLVSLVNFAVISRPGGTFADLASSPYLQVDEGLLRQLDEGETERIQLPLTSGREAALMRITSMDISSTGIRGRIKAGRSVKYLLPEEVQSFIISHKLYNKKAEEDMVRKGGNHLRK